MPLPTRAEAQKLLEEYVTEPYQLLHAKMNALALEAYAEKFGEDKDLWYITGLLHDLDYDKFPDEHPDRELAWFKEWDYPKELIHAVDAHAFGYKDYMTEPQTKLAKTLLATDELCGIIHAYSLMRPTGYEGMKASKAKKKFKDKSFAAKVDRDVIKKGVDAMEIDLTEHLAFLIGVFQDL
ncbi:HD domain-containing protein [Candidatus Dojkabacteria bacterium]|nr:HD domain-containing protein [Candidatus Dojkabacteria bacterium]